MKKEKLEKGGISSAHWAENVFEEKKDLRPHQTSMLILL